MVDAFLIKPKMSLLRQIGLQLASDYEVLDSDYQIYVPDSFVFGNFKERKDGFKLSEGGIFYRNSLEALEKYSEFLDAGKMEVVRNFEMPDRYLKNLMDIGEEHLHHKKHISRLVSELLD